MKRIFISGGITNVHDYINRFCEAERELIDRGYTSIVNPAVVNVNLPIDFSHEDYMEVSLAELRCCGAVYMLKGWKDSAGAVQEHNTAKRLEMEIIYQ